MEAIGAPYGWSREPGKPGSAKRRTHRRKVGKIARASRRYNLRTA